MSYTPTNWKSGDVVTSAKLNNIEQGIANATLLVNATQSDSGLTCDTKASVMYNAITNGQTIVINIPEIGGAFTVITATAANNRYEFLVYYDEYVTFAATSGDDYPTASDG